MRTDVILLGHGSRRNNATDVGLQEVVRRLQQRLKPPVRVRLAGFEFTRPSLAEAIAAVAADGGERTIVVPYFLFPGREVRVKIPAELEELRHAHPGLEITYTDCLGADPLMVEVAAERVRELQASQAWRNTAGTDRPLGVVLISRGSRAPEADAGLQQVAVGVGDALGGVLVQHAQAEIGQPRLPEAVSALIERGAGAIAVQPYLIFPGSVLLDTVKPALEQCRRQHPGVPIALTRILGVDERMIDLALARALGAGLPESAVAAPVPA